MSEYLLAALVAWILAQGSKVGIALATDKNTWRAALTRSGGMPSSHSALMVSQLTVIGFKDGTDGPLFALVAVIALIVMYDAINVRRAVGEQGDVLTDLLASMKIAKEKYVYKQADGHLLPEVLVGAIIGFLSGIVVLALL